MNAEQLLNNTKHFVKHKLKHAEAGHDWFHIQRVLRNSILIAEAEKADLLIVQLGALLHDIADSKFHNGDESVGPKVAQNFLKQQQTPDSIIEHVVNIVKHISFKGGNEKVLFSSPELNCIQDADRLDAIGAIGIARTFNYGGYKGRSLYDPKIKANLNLTKSEYKASNAPTINHFYEKLLLLKDRMNTETGKFMAKERHEFMLQYLEEFYKEWGNLEESI